MKEIKPPSSPANADTEDGECFYCGERTSHYAGDPGMWPLRFCQRDGTGITRYHHTRCVTDRLNGIRAQCAPGRGTIAKAIWQAEYRRATGKERSIDWFDVAQNDRDKYLFLADAIISSSSSPE